MAHILQADKIDWRKYAEESEESANVLPASAYVDETVRLFFPEPTAQPYPGLPWQKTGDRLLFRPEEVTMWLGINGHGKSLITGQVVTSLVAVGHKVLVASFEMKPHRTLARMTRQASQGEHPTEGFVRKFATWTDERLWFYDQQNRITPQRMAQAVRYAAQELGCSHIFIDNLAKVVHKEDAYNDQKDFIDEMCRLAMNLKIHIHIVHHIRKGENEEKVPGKFDAKGSGSLSDAPDNFLVVWRNKRKERDAEQGKANDEADALLCCDKQRNGDWEGRIALWFHRASTQYCENSACHPKDLMT